MTSEENDKGPQEAHPEPPPATPDILEEGYRPTPPPGEPDYLTKAEEPPGKK